MSVSVKKGIVGFMLASAIVSTQAQAQIQTRAIGKDYENLPPSELKQFSGATPCYLMWSKEFPKILSSVSKSLKGSGINITDDEKANCQIHITGYMTIPSQTSGSVPVNLLSVLESIDKYDVVGPALKTASQDESGTVANNAAGISGGIDASGINALSQVGGVVNSMNGSVVGALIGVLADVANGIHARKVTPPGVVYINAEVIFDGWIPGTKRPALVLGAYAASDTPEKPEVLIDAGVKRVAQAIWEHTAAFDKKKGIAFTMPTILQSDTDATKQNSAAGQEVANPAVVADKSIDQSITPPSSAQPAPSEPAQGAAQANSAAADAVQAAGK